MKTSGWIKVFITIYYLVGILGLTLPVSRDFFGKLIPFSLIMSTFIVFLFHREWNMKIIFSFGIIYLLGFGIEAVGVNTGLIFGQYMYGHALGWKLFDTPLLIGINWLLLVYGVYHLTAGKMRRLPSVLAGSALLVIYDLALEPVAIQYAWWIWNAGVVPVQNYLAWYLTAVVLLAILQLAGRQPRNTMASWVFIVQFFFFIAINLM